jgi:plastocyanin
MLNRSFWQSLALLGVMALAARGAEFGDVIGQIVLDGEAPKAEAINVTKDAEFCGKHMLVNEELLVDPETKGISNVVIFIRSKIDANAVNPEVAAAVQPKVVLDNKNCRFEPHVAVVWYDKQALELLNSDTIGHNSNLAPIGDKAVNPLLAANATQDYSFKKKQNLPVPVSCNIHPWMKGYVVVRDNPYTVVTPVDGKFKLEKIPVGKHEFAVWHEKSGWVDTKAWPKGKFEFEVKAGENDWGTVKIDPKLFAKKK